jgi:thiamine phosphate synthase YjbQ (UPF0047 family)
VIGSTATTVLLTTTQPEGRRGQMFGYQAKRLKTRLEVATSSFSGSKIDQISNEIEQLLGKLSCVDLTQVLNSPKPFLQLTQSAREDLELFRDLNQQILKLSPDSSQYQHQCGEDRADVEQDLKQLHQIFQVLIDNPQQWDQEVRIRLSNSGRDITELVSLTPSPSLLFFSVCRLDQI